MTSCPRYTNPYVYQSLSYVISYCSWMMNSKKMKILFAIILVPVLTVAVLRQYLQYLWTKKNDGESSGFTNTTIFDIINDLKTIFWNNTHAAAQNDTAFPYWCDPPIINFRWFSSANPGYSRASLHSPWFSTNWHLNWHGTYPATSPSKLALVPDHRGLITTMRLGCALA